MDAETERKILASRERQKSYKWQVRSFVDLVLGLILVLITANLGWIPVAAAIGVAVMAIVSVCIVMTFYYIYRSIVVRPPMSDGIADAPSHQSDRCTRDHRDPPASGE